MDDKEIKNDLPGPVSHFSTQACCSPSSSLSYSHTLIHSLLPPPYLLPLSLRLFPPPATPAAHLPPAPQTRDDSA